MNSKESESTILLTEVRLPALITHTADYLWKAEMFLYWGQITLVCNTSWEVITTSACLMFFFLKQNRVKTDHNFQTRANFTKANIEEPRCGVFALQSSYLGYLFSSLAPCANSNQNQFSWIFIIHLLQTRNARNRTCFRFGTFSLNFWPW